MSVDEPFECKDIALQFSVDKEIDEKLTSSELHAAMAEHIDRKNGEHFPGIPPVHVKPIVGIVIKQEAVDLLEHKDPDYIPSNESAQVRGVVADSEDDFPSHSWTRATNKQPKTRSSGNEKPKPILPRLLCELCGNISNSKRQYDSHYESVHLNNTYDCDICGRR